MPSVIHTAQTLLGRFCDRSIGENPSINDRFHAVSTVTVSHEPTDIASPVEARIHHIGTIESTGDLIGKHGQHLSVREIFGEAYAKHFHGYHYANLYLSPKNIHFFVFPTDGTIVHTERHEGTGIIPTLLAIENLLGIEILASAVRRNACIGSVLRTTRGYDLGIVPIGSLNVNRISMTDTSDLLHKKGDWYGDFSLGSTVLILYPPSLAITKRVGDTVGIGETLLREV